MRKITFLLFALIAFNMQSNAQIFIQENLDSGFPTGWSQVSYFASSTATYVCEGSGNIADNLYGSASNDGTFTSPNFVGASNETDAVVSFDWLARPYSTNAVDYIIFVEYSTNDGTDWNLVSSFAVTETTACTTYSEVIPSANIPLGSDFKFRIRGEWQSGDSYFYLDNILVSQTSADAPNCDSVLATTVDVSIAGDISWNGATGIPTGYDLTVGTATGGSDVLSTSLGNVTTVNLGLLAYSTTYYVNLVPTNANGSATDCVEQTFVTEAQPPAGTDCLNAIAVASLPYSTSDDTANYGDTYSGSPGASCDSTSGYLNGDDVVYSYTASADISVNFEAAGVGTYTGLFVYTDCSDIGTTCTSGAVNGSAGGDLSYDLELTTGTTYYVVISTWANPQNTVYTLNITENTCTNATAIYTIVNDCDNSGGFFIDVEVTDMGTATALTVSDDQASATQSLTAIGTVQFGPYVNATDVVISIADDNDANCFLNSSALTQVACPPVNDACENAITINAGDSISGDTTGATNVEALTVCEGGTVGTTCDSGGDSTPNGGFLVFGTGVWYVYNSPGNESISIEDSAGAFDSEIQVWSGACGSLVCVAGDDDSSIVGNGGFVCFDSEATATTYYIYIDGNAATGVGAYTLNLNTTPLPPANDECAAAEALTLGVEITGDNTGATDSALATDCFTGVISDLWYSFVAPASGEVTVTTTAAQYAVYSDCAGAVVGECNVSVVGDLTEGTTYYVRVSDDGTARSQVTGSFTLLVSEAVLSTSDFTNQSLFSYYPNPVSDNLTLKAQKEISNVSVYNMIGQEVYRNAPNSVNNSVDMSNLQAGAYFVKVTIDNVTETIKVIKK
ncbi:T9SS type A sorting domain-containing protein [Olleya sp. 1-3]|uniref:T9SS type A sorting domain-containing protein n=1 Tax=Olleya sp. 1-3 TaxID=2058323 RepID=UPI000C322FBB|nr:T9SS type A sorting domain-containing protein [Olleya sp. 1-3]PKG52411.1 hypothetical protein CXF54_04895 [Olleya sp. 1-3]